MTWTDLIMAWLLIVCGACLVALTDNHQLPGAVMFFVGTTIVIAGEVK